MTIKDRDAKEVRLIEEAIKRGMVRVFPKGHTSGWDDIPFKEKHRILFSRLKGRNAIDQ